VTCSSIRATFALSDVAEVASESSDGEFIVAVFFSSDPSPLHLGAHFYIVTRKDQATLGLAPSRNEAPPAQTDQDRKEFAKTFNKSWHTKAIAVRFPGTYASADGTRLTLHSPQATKSRVAALFANEQFLDSLRIYGFTEFVYTNDRDQTFTLDLTRKP
jgi:hypothetical protein